MKIKVNNIEKQNLKCISIAISTVCLISLGLIYARWELREDKFLSPLSSKPAIAYAREIEGYVAPTPYVPDNIDIWVDKYVRKYFKTDYEISKMKQIAHCLLLCESKHGTDDGMGDNGRAGGILQFHEPTYIANRQRMMKLELVDHLGNRFDDEDAIETAVWMWSQGQLNQWGPYSRGECR